VGFALAKSAHDPRNSGWVGCCHRRLKVSVNVLEESKDAHRSCYEGDPVPTSGKQIGLQHGP
jgi:hypothetical protein